MSGVIDRRRHNRRGRDTVFPRFIVWKAQESEGDEINLTAPYDQARELVARSISSHLGLDVASPSACTYPEGILVRAKEIEAVVASSRRMDNVVFHRSISNRTHD
jgi:hypothetical protein